MLVKKFAGNVLAAAVAAVSIPTAIAAPSLVINDGAPIDILSPPGFSYVANGLTSMLKVTTDGYVICANIGTASATPVSMQPQHLRWTLPSANDIPTVGYSGGVLSINKQIETSLACQVRGPLGEVRTPFSGFGDMVFRDSWEGFSDVQFANLVNWIPVPTFSWSAPDWTKVPNDACTWDQDPNLPMLAENALCAAVAGVRPVAGGSQNDARYGDRAPTMWTQTTASKFIYVARIDARFGPPSGGPNSHFPVNPPSARPDQSSTVDVAIRDAYDSNYLTASGTYCLLKQLPPTLDDNVCNSSDVYYSGSLAGNPGGILSERIPLAVGFTQAASLFVAVVRGKTTDLPLRCTPAAAIAVLADPGVSRGEAGDEFIGDDVAFGFYGNEMFPWMGACP